MIHQNKKQPESEAVRLFREYILQHYTNAPIKGSDKEFRSSQELAWKMHETMPGLTAGEVSKVMRELDFETDYFEEFPAWVLYRIDGEKLLEKEFGVSRDGD